MLTRNRIYKSNVFGTYYVINDILNSYKGPMGTFKSWLSYWLGRTQQVQNKNSDRRFRDRDR